MAENALVPLNQLTLPPGVDTTGMSEEDIRILAEFYAQELQMSKQGVDLQPVRITINKDNCTFTDPVGGALDELRGVLVYKHKARGYWPRDYDENTPACGSMDGVTGQLSEPGKVAGLPIVDGQKCSECPFNQWGSGVDESGNETRGKACKEMRRLFLITEGSQMPALLTLPPTSIREFDRHISARMQQGIADIAAEVVITLTPQGEGKRRYAVAQFKKGKTLAPQEMLRFAKMRSDIQAAAEKVGLDMNEDYGGDATGGPTADTGGAEDDPF